MKLKLFAVSLVTSLIMAGVVLSFETVSPETFIDKGACPFECCTYRMWYTDKETGLYEKPEIGSKIVATAESGAKVEALTGEVHVTAGIFSVENAFARYRPGDLIWVYTYMGEGRFKVWFEDRFYEEEFDFSPFGSSAYKSRFGTFKKEPVSVWWILIQTQSGEVGWSNLPDNFSNKDACS